MAMKEKIRVRRDMELKIIHESQELSNDEKLTLSDLVSESAECTNGYTEMEKVQHLSETTFGIISLITRLMISLNKNNTLTNSLSEKLDDV